MKAIHRPFAALLLGLLVLSPAAIQADLIDSKEVVYFLAAPELAGRFTGSPGELRAARLIAEKLQLLGAQPLPGASSFLVPYESTTTLQDEGTSKVQTVQAQNVVGYFPANTSDALPNEFIGLGAHYDHLGLGDRVGSSKANDKERGKPHVGADDNASGVASTIEAAEVISRQPRRRPILLLFWSGEEIGTLGSLAFIKHGPLPAGRVIAYVNQDMVGRVRDNKLSVMGIGSSDVITSAVTRANQVDSFNLATIGDPYNFTDSLSYYLADVPVANLFSGTHEDYHRPTDTADKINYPDLDRVGRFAARLVLDLANGPRPDFKRVERPAGFATPGQRGRSRVSLGTIPGYTSTAKGLELEGVVAGSPAEKAGLKKGDILTSLGGQPITGIHDFTKILGTLKVGVEIPIRYDRAGTVHDGVITPAASRAH